MGLNINDYGKLQAKQQIKLVRLAMEKAKETGDYRKWADFIRTHESNIAWYLNIQLNGKKAVRRMRLR